MGILQRSMALSIFRLLLFTVQSHWPGNGRPMTVGPAASRISRNIKGQPLSGLGLSA